MTTISFSVFVNPCYYKCSYCWDSDYNTCLDCNAGYYKYGYECLDECIEGTFPQVINGTGKCVTCPNKCLTCFGDDETSECTSCKSGNLYLNNGCYTNCPIGYWNDYSDYTCKSCHSYCNNCTGPLSS
jgi:proprotein convertase subtilisin/kexin type 5